MPLARATSFSAVRISAASFSSNAAVRRHNSAHPFRHAELGCLAVAFGSASICASITGCEGGEVDPEPGSG